MFLYYVVIEALYLVSPNDFGDKQTIGQLIALYNVPVILFFVFVRLRLLKPVNERSNFLDVTSFAIPIVLIVACLAAWIWIGIILSVLGGVLTGYEFIRSIVKMDSMLLRK